MMLMRLRSVRDFIKADFSSVANCISGISNPIIFENRSPYLIKLKPNKGSKFKMIAG